MRVATALTTIALIAGTTACGGKGFPAISPVEAHHLHSYDISSEAMENALRPGDVIAANDSVKVQRGSIIVFVGPPSWQASAGGQGHLTFVKRVIAVGGDHIVCCDPSGRLVLNGHPLAEPYLYPGVKASDQPFDVMVPIGRLFLLGDNRPMSADSRFHRNDHDGTIPLSDVVGVVTRILKPPRRAGLIPTHT